eukprot:5303066-Lingulodinium_polyedra.AAC.1
MWLPDLLRPKQKTTAIARGPWTPPLAPPTAAHLMPSATGWRNHTLVAPGPHFAARTPTNCG